MMTSDRDRAAQRETAAYSSTRNWLAHTTDLPEAELDRLALEAVEDGVWGHDAPRNRDGTRQQQGVGSPGHETANHFQAIRRYCGEEAWKEAVREIQKRDPERHAKLGLPKMAT
jgi:hypothetical protein